MIHKEKPADFNPKFEVVSCFLEHNGKFLLLLRHDHKPQGNTWGAPAGKVETGENSDEAIAREVWEETGYKLSLSEVGNPQTLYVQFPEYDFVYHTYRIPVSELREIALEHSGHKEYCWVTPQEALTMPLIQDMDACIRLFYGIPES